MIHMENKFRLFNLFFAVFQAKNEDIKIFLKNYYFLLAISTGVE
jgi:hypothetical protein